MYQGLGKTLSWWFSCIKLISPCCVPVCQMNKWCQQYLILLGYNTDFFINIYLFIFKCSNLSLDPSDYEAIVEMYWTVLITEPLMVSFQAPSIVVYLETNPHTKTCFQVRGIPRLPTTSVRMLQWTWMGFCCQRNLLREKLAWRSCQSYLLFFHLMQGKENGACMHPYLCRVSVFIDDLG